MDGKASSRSKRREAVNQNHSTKGEVKNRPKPSTKLWDVLRKHLAVFSEHYRQPVSELSVIAYAEDLADLTAEQLDAACNEARRTSEFMPVSATIRAAHEKRRKRNETIYLGPPMLTYPEVSQAEREAALQYSEDLRKKLSNSSPEPQPKKRKLTLRPSKLTICEQKEILRRKGFL